MNKIPPRTWTLIIAAVALISLVLLAGSLNILELEPGERIRFQEVAPDVVDESVEDDTMRFLLAALRVLVIFTWILLPIYIILLIVSKEARKRFLRDMAMLLPILFLLYMLSQRQTAERDSEGLNPNLGRSPLEDLASTPPPPPSEFTPPEPWVTTLTIILIALAIASLAAGIIYFLWKRSRERAYEPLRRVEEEAQAAIDAIESGGDLREVILRAYLQMIEALKEYRGIYRDRDMTPHEFELFLQKRGMPYQPVHQITQLFEQVRYGAYVPGRQDERAAVKSLSAIVAACQKTRTE